MVKVIALKCPECGGSFTIEEGRETCFCTYCGTQILIDDGSKTYTFHKIDEARIREAETTEKIKLKELELKETEYADKQKKTKLKIGCSIPLGIFGALSLMAAFSDNDPDSPLFYIGVLPLFALALMWFGNNNEGDDN